MAVLIDSIAKTLPTLKGFFSIGLYTYSGLNGMNQPYSRIKALDGLKKYGLSASEKRSLRKRVNKDGLKLKEAKKTSRLAGFFFAVSDRFFQFVEGITTVLGSSIGIAAVVCALKKLAGAALKLFYISSVFFIAASACSFIQNLRYIYIAYKHYRRIKQRRNKLEEIKGRRELSIHESKELKVLNKKLEELTRQIKSHAIQLVGDAICIVGYALILGFTGCSPLAASVAVGIGAITSYAGFLYGKKGEKPGRGKKGKKSGSRLKTRRLRNKGMKDRRRGFVQKGSLCKTGRINHLVYKV